MHCLFCVFLFPVLDSQYTRPTTDAAEQPTEPNTRLDGEISELLTREPKEEPVEYSISWGSEPEEQTEVNNFNVPDCVKSEPEEEEANIPYITSSYHIQKVEYNSDSTESVAEESIEQERSELEDDSFMESEEDSVYSLSHMTEVSKARNAYIQN